MIPIITTIAFLVSVSLTHYFSRPQTLLYIVDEPNARSLHVQPTPISGGVAMLTSFAVATIITCWVYPLEYHFLWLCLSGLLVAIISFIDDCRSLSPSYRLIVHFFAALLLLWQGNYWLNSLNLPGYVWQLSDWLQISLSLLFIIWMINLYNFMDGMDGFAGGMAVFGFGTLALLGGLANHESFMIINLIVASVAFGFLLFNFPPACIFMGDTGASSLGFLAAALSLWGSREGIFPIWIAILLFSPFIVDATITLLRRLLRREKIWEAHKSHYYQRLVELGWGHKRTVLWEYVLMAGCSFSAIFALYLPPIHQWLLLLGWGLLYGFLIYIVNWLEKRQQTQL